MRPCLEKSKTNYVSLRKTNIVHFLLCIVRRLLQAMHSFMNIYNGSQGAQRTGVRRGCEERNGNAV